MGSFQIAPDAGQTCFMISVCDSLYIGTANDDGGIVERIHEFKLDKITKEFNVKGGEIWRRRAKTPLFERTALQFKDIIGFLKHNKETSGKIMSVLIDIALDLSKAEEGYLDYIDMESEVALKYEKNEGISHQESAFVYKNPTIALKEIAERVLIRLIIAYRKLPGAISLIRGNTFKPGKNFIQELADLLPKDHPDRTSFECDNNWVKELYDIRGDIEHEKWEVIPFEVVRSDQNKSCHVKPCRVAVKSQGYNPINLVSYLSVTFCNMVTFIEDMVALALADKMLYPVRLVTLPESEQAKRGHFKYIVDLVPEVKMKLPQN